MVSYDQLLCCPVALFLLIIVLVMCHVCCVDSLEFPVVL